MADQFSIDKFLKTAEQRVEGVMKSMETAAGDVDKIFGGVDGIIEHSGKMFEGDFDNFADSLPSVIEQVNKLSGSIESSHPIFSGFSEVLNTLSGGLTSLNTAVNVYKQSMELLNFVMNANPAMKVAAVLMGLVTLFMHLWNTSDGFREAVTKLFEGFMPLVETAKSVFQSLVDAGVELWGRLTDLFSTLIENILGTFQSLYSALVEGELISGLVNGVLNWFNELFGGLTEVVTNIIGAVVTGFQHIYDTIQSYLTMAWEIVGSILNYWKETFFNVLNFLKSLVSGDFQGMKDAIQNQMESIRTLIASIWNAVKAFFSEVLNNLWSIVRQKFSDIVDSVRERMNSVKDSAVNIWNEVKAFFANVLNNLWNTVRQKFSDIVDSVRERMNSVKETAVGIWNDIQSFFDGINLLQTGKDIINGLWNGIKSMGSSLARNITRFISDYIPGPVAKALGIASPSKVMAHLAKWIPEGMAVGIDNNIKTVEDSVLSMASAVPKELEAPVVNMAKIDTPDFGIYERVNRINQGMSKQTENHMNSELRTSKQPLNLTVRFGNSEFSRFVDDISHVQDRKDFRMRRSPRMA